MKKVISKTKDINGTIIQLEVYRSSPAKELVKNGHKHRWTTPGLLGEDFSLGVYWCPGCGSLGEVTNHYSDEEEG